MSVLCLSLRLSIYLWMFVWEKETERDGLWLPAHLDPSNICQTFGSLCCLVSSLCIQAGNEGSAENGQKETSTCDICQFGAECDVDAEDVW